MTVGKPAFGQTYILICSVEGATGSPTFQWISPDSTTTTTDTLTIGIESLSDAGLYTCQSTLSGVVREATENVMLQGWHNPCNLRVFGKMMHSLL